MTDEMDLRDEYRLPWLETMEPNEQQRAPVGRVLAIIVLGLALLVAIVFLVYRLQHPVARGDGTLIAAEEGPYKVRPDDPGGLKVVGEGDSAVATSAGKGGGSGAIDLNALPERPIEATVASTAPTARSSKSPTGAVPMSGAKLVAAAPMEASRPVEAAPAVSGSLVQLGAYPSTAAANSAWTSFAKRFAYLTDLGKVVQPVAAGGKTLYRLRVNAGGANEAADICGRLRVAGETCFVAS